MAKAATNSRDVSQLPYVRICGRRSLSAEAFLSCKMNKSKREAKHIMSLKCYSRARCVKVRPTPLCVFVKFPWMDVSTTCREPGPRMIKTKQECLKSHATLRNETPGVHIVAQPFLGENTKREFVFMHECFADLDTALVTKVCLVMAF